LIGRSSGAVRYDATMLRCHRSWFMAVHGASMERVFGVIVINPYDT
jgi:hypothetical protein